MQREMTALNEQFRARGLPEFAIGVGVNSGPMSVGNMGSQARFDYTVLGDAVNLGARLESMTKEVGGQILVGERTAEAAADRFAFRELARVRVQGRQAPARVFELVSEAAASPLSADDLELYATALDALCDRRWAVAETAAAQFAERHPDDRPCAVLRERIAALAANPPDEDWDGTLEQRSK
jgi:adenylate cyclase